MQRFVPSAAACLAVLVALVGPARAGVTFEFTESGGNVLMQASGTLDTTKLVPGNFYGWGNTGTQNNAIGNGQDFMGANNFTAVIGTGFVFHAGTDLQPWFGDMFTTEEFGWSYAGTTPFATYGADGGGNILPGISLASSQIVGGVWTPDVSWSIAGTFASVGLTPGTYTITDAVTSESITIQIGARAAVPEPSSVVLLGIGAGVVGVGAVCRRRRAGATPPTA